MIEQLKNIKSELEQIADELYQDENNIVILAHLEHAINDIRKAFIILAVRDK